jgi:hypothetical protein
MDRIALEPAIETSFHLPEITEDFFGTEVWVHIHGPGDARARVPAFYDGDGLWRVRYSPVRAGRYRIDRVTVGPEHVAAVHGLQQTEFDVAEDAVGDFVRVDAENPRRFTLDSGEPYFPIGHNVGWATLDEFQSYFDKMGAAGENWSRVWMAHWSALNLDWVPPRHGLQPVAENELSLEVAQTWDGIVAAAARNGIRFQMALQHHGQYTTRVNPAWDDNPWNKTKGGFLDDAAEFFTSERAKELTKLKYRYAVARWGYSAAVMAWELFNEVQWTDAYRNGDIEAIARWHTEMAEYIRSVDPHEHLVTTSSMPSDSPIYEAMDYYQPHRYRRDLIASVSAFDAPARELAKPIFYGEMGDMQAPNPRPDEDKYLHAMVWAGLMSGGSGAAQCWSWKQIEETDFYAQLQSVAEFIRQSGMAARGLAPTAVSVLSAERGPLVFAPQRDWARHAPAEVHVPADGGPISGLEAVSRYLHGSREKQDDGFPGWIRLRVNAPRRTTLAIEIGKVAKGGATARVLVDGRERAAREWPAAESDTEPGDQLIVDVPKGRHVIAVESVGADWFTIDSFTLADYAPALSALAAASGDAAVVWVYHRAGIYNPEGGVATAEGHLVIPKMETGRYQVVWWDTMSGTEIVREAAVARKGKLRLSVPPVNRDMAAYLVRQ